MNMHDVELPCAYNRWANERVLRAVAALSDDQLRRHLGSSYGLV